MGFDVHVSAGVIEGTGWIHAGIVGASFICNVVVISAFGDKELRLPKAM